MFRKNLKIFSFVIVTLAIALSFSTVFAQSEEFRLGITRTFGYNSGDQLQGTMKLYIIGDTKSIKSVDYLIDGKKMGTGTSPSFDLSFLTSDYSFGYHDLSAIVQTQDGRTVNVAVRRFNFVTPSEMTSGALRIVVPLFGIILAVILLGVGAQVLLFKNKFSKMAPGTPRNYGFKGGTICPRCKRPYAMHWWAINAGIRTRFDRCDFCGKWAIVGPKSIDELRAAEQRELQTAEGSMPLVEEKTEDEKLREMLDKSKYSD